MNRRWKSILIIVLVVLMLVAVTGTAMAYKKNHNNNRHNDRGTYPCQWAAFDTAAAEPTCIGNFSMYQQKYSIKVKNKQTDRLNNRIDLPKDRISQNTQKHNRI